MEPPPAAWGRPPGEEPSAGPTVLLVRLGARGDVVFASPLVRALRRRHPGARIVWVVEPAAADLVRHHPEVDRVVVWPRPAWVRLLKGGRLLSLIREVLAFRRLLREERAELAVDLHGLARSAWVARLSGARQVVGLGAREGSRLLVDRVVPRDGGDVLRIASEYLHLAEVLGWDTSAFQPEVHPGTEAREEATTLLAGRGVVDPYVVLAPFTTRPQKHWREERWGPLAEAIHRERGLRPVLLGGPADRAAAARIVAGAPEGLVVDLVGATSLGGAAAVVEGASLVVGVDTGLTHLGVATGRPTVALFGSTLPYTHAPGQEVTVLHTSMACAPCRTHPTCGGAWTCMERLEVAAVLAAARAAKRAAGEARPGGPGGDPSTDRGPGRHPRGSTS